MTLPALFLVAAISAAGAGAPSAVRDQAGLFSPQARQKADEEIAALQDVYHLDMVIETTDAPPEELGKKIAGKKPSQAARVLRDWAMERADQENTKGVYVLICKPPGDVQVVVAPEALSQEFTAYDAKRLRSLLANMKTGPAHAVQRDKRLLEAIVQIREAVSYNLRPPFPWLPVGGVLVGVLVLWAVLSLVRRRLRGAEPREALRLNLYNALLGGMFGTVAGHWIIDTLFVAASRSVVPPEPVATSLPMAPPVEPVLETQPDRLDLAARD